MTGWKLVYTHIGFSGDRSTPAWMLVHEGMGVLLEDSYRAENDSVLPAFRGTWGVSSYHVVSPQPAIPDHIAQGTLAMGLLGVSPVDITKFPAIVKILENKA